MNYLQNPSFEHTPEPWAFSFSRDDVPNPHDSSPGARFQLPETHILSRNDLPAHEHALFILDGDHTLKIAKHCGSWYGSIVQKVHLPAGTYTLAVRIFGDLVKGYVNGRKVWGDDPQGRDGLTRFVVNGVDQAWLHLKPGHWNTKSLKFKAVGLTDICVDIMCPFPLQNAGIFADKWSLTREADPKPDPDPEPDPDPDYVHVYTVIPDSFDQDEACAIFRTAWEKLQ